MDEHSVMCAANTQLHGVGTPGAIGLDNMSEHQAEIKTVAHDTPVLTKSRVAGMDDTTMGSTGENGEEPAAYFGSGDCTDRLSQPRLISGAPVTGSKADKRRLKKENKVRRIEGQLVQDPPTWWTKHDGSFTAKVDRKPAAEHRGGMCPSNLALHHPAGALLEEYATEGCPADTGLDWSAKEVAAAVEFGYHKMEASAIDQFRREALEKQERGLVEILDWDGPNGLKHNPPKNMKTSPLSAVVHKSRGWRAILDLSWVLKHADETVTPAVNETTTKLAPKGSIDQLGHVLQRLIYAMATAPDGKNVYMAKWDVKDGFWQMVNKLGAEWSFCYVLPEHDGKPRQIVKPLSLQMGGIDSPPFFGVASETGRDVMQVYAQSPLGVLPEHKFEHYTTSHPDFERLPLTVPNQDSLHFTFEVFVHDFIGFAVAESQEHLRHLSRAALHGIHDVFPAEEKEEDDPNSVKKLKKQDGAWALDKDALGFDFDGEQRTLLLDKPKREKLLSELTSWVRLSKKKGTKSAARIDFTDFRRVISQCRHAAICVPSGRGFFSLSETLAAKDDGRQWMYIRFGSVLYKEVEGLRWVLTEATAAPTKCTELVTGWPDYIGIVDASTEAVGCILVGENESIEPIVCRLEWPEEVRKLILCHKYNPDGKVTNSDLECAGKLFLWLVIECCVPDLAGKHIALLSDNTPTVSWVTKMTSKKSAVAAAYLRILAVRLKLARASPLIPMHIPGEENGITDIPSRSFGRIAKWDCDTDEKFLTLFNKNFPLPQQNSWTIFHLPSDLCSKVISVLVTQCSEPAEWRRPSRPKTSIGTSGFPMRKLWEWTLTCRTTSPSTTNKSEPSQDLLGGSRQDTTATAARSSLERSLRLSRPLARRFPWCAGTTHSK